MYHTKQGPTCSKICGREEARNSLLQHYSNIQKEFTFEKTCHYCGEKFTIKKKVAAHSTKLLKDENRSYCSRACVNHARKHSKETRKKISKALKGKIPHNKGTTQKSLEERLLKYKPCKCCGVLTKK